MPLLQLYKTFQHWGDRGACWVISDPHFNDDDMLEFFNYPKAEELVKKINSKVGKYDTLICLGDVGNIEYVRQLRGYKVLICGNHDVGYSNYERKKIYEKFDSKEYTEKEAIDTMKKEYPNCVISSFGEGYDFHQPFTYWYICADNKLFDEVYSGTLQIGEKILLSHEPIEEDYTLNIHGHDHSGWHCKDDYHYNVCANIVNFEPISMNKLLKSGVLSKVESIHRTTIDEATKRKQKRESKSIRVKDCLNTLIDCNCIIYRDNNTDKVLGYASYRVDNVDLVGDNGFKASLNDIVKKYDWVRNDLIVWI